MRRRHAEDGGDDRERLSAVVAALRQPDAFPGVVRAVETVETHMSWVFLTEAHAYKLKKPVRTPFVDNTTIEARLRACETELALDRRLAPDVYLAVVPIVARGGALSVEGDGTALDWLVKMRRLPRDRMLDACIARADVRPAAVDRLAEILAGFYARADRAPSGEQAYRAGIAADIDRKRASLESPRYGLSRSEVQAVAAAQVQRLARLGGQLDARASRVVDAHGDLRPEHVCLEREPVVIDCLEFSRALRLLDPISELSFLALECRRLGAGWVGDRLLADYARLSGDQVPPSVVAFYQSYHALVRAAVAVWHLDDDALEHTDSWPQRAGLYLRMARELL